MNDKRQLRKRLKQVLLNIPEELRRRQERSVYAQVIRHPVWAGCRWVFGFLPMGGEFNLEPLLEEALKNGKEIALPRVDGAELVFHHVSGLDQNWVVHSYGMREPDGSLPVINPADAAEEGLLVLVPGLGFDEEGYRLGYGGGFYDRLLGGLPGSAETASCLFREQLVAHLPRESYDRKVARLFFDPES